MSKDLADLSQIAGERREAAYYLSEANQRINHWRAHQRRIEEVDAIYRGDFHVVFGDEATVEKPKAVNIVQLALDGRVATATSVPLTYRCDDGREKKRPRNEKRERIAYYYDEANDGDLLRAKFYADLDACGVNYKLVWPDFDKGYPCVKRLDPRTTFPDALWTPDRDMKSLITATKVARNILEADYPEHEWADCSEGAQDLINVYSWYDRSEFVKVAEYQVKVGYNKTEKRGVELSRISNKMGRIPIVTASRVTLDSEPRGLFDQMLGTLNSENLALNLLFDASQDFITSQMVQYGIENPEDIGTGKVLNAREPNAYARRNTPDSVNPQMFAVLQQQGDNSRRGAVYPEGQLGESQASVVSAAGINALNSPYNNSVAMSQRIEAASWAKVMSLCFEVDEKYLDDGSRKYISGAAAGREFSESYIPSVDIKGDYNIKATYGANTGGDRYGTEIRMTQAVSNGLLPKKTAMENSQFIRDVVEAEKQIIREQILAAGMSFVQAKAANPEAPDFAPAAALLAALDGDDTTIYLTLAQFKDIQNPAPPVTTGTEAFTEASSIARGGTPGQTTNVPGVGALPSLDELGLGSALAS